MHRDIKPENILFARSADGRLTLKLADFGLAIDLRAEAAVTRAGTLDYMAPEVGCCCVCCVWGGGRGASSPLRRSLP